MVKIVFAHSLRNLVWCSIRIAIRILLTIIRLRLSIIRILLSVVKLRLSVIRIWLSVVWTLVWYWSRCTAVRAGSEVIRILCST